MRVLIDSDVYLDYVLQRDPHDAYATLIFEAYGYGGFEIFVCALSPTTIFYFTRKAKGIAGGYAAIHDVLATAQICPVNKDVLADAENLGFSDFEDAVQCASAVAEGLDAIVTRNTKDFGKSPIPVYSPKEFLRVLDSESGKAERE